MGRLRATTSGEAASFRVREDGPIRIGVSACLLGEEVRFDGGHKRDDFLVNVLGPFVEWVPVCPEVELGLGVPRETLRLERRRDRVAMVGVESGVDHTAVMRRFAEQRVAALAGAELCGYVLKKNSPSCGMDHVRVYGAGGAPTRNGRGLFAEALLRRLPNLPVEEEGRLRDARLRENFVERVFAYRRFRALFGAHWRLRDLVAFHAAHKLQVLAHSPKAYAELGRLVARAHDLTRGRLRESYQATFMGALKKIATPTRHASVLYHIVGHLRRGLGDEERRELVALVEDYRRGFVPLIVPITLIRHQVRRLGVGYLEGQVYLEPHPKELMLRNHVQVARAARADV